jgi:hypothetical protein
MSLPRGARPVLGLLLAGLALPAWGAAQAAPPPSGPPTSGTEGHTGEPPVVLQPGASPWFPATRLFRPPMADPGEPGFRGAALSTDLLRGGVPDAERPPPQVEGLRAGGRDFQGVVSLGESYPIRRFGSGADGVQLGIQVGVTARFRLATSRNEYVASDWIVGVPAEFARGPVSGRAVLFHRSAHLGDEIMETAGVRRVGFGHEGLMLLVGNRGTGPLRVYAGGARLFRSETTGTLEELGRGRADGWEAQGGLEVERSLSGPGGPLAGFGALDLQLAERTGWSAQWSALAGVAFRARNRSGRVAVRWLHGPSMHGEFFLTPETAWGMELRLTR